MKISNVRTLELNKIPVVIPLQSKPVYSTVRLVSIETDEGLVGWLVSKLIYKDTLDPEQGWITLPIGRAWGWN